MPALAFALTGGKGLGLVVSNAGNTDKLQLMTVDTSGKVVPLKNVSLGAGIAEDAWYRLTMQIQLGFPRNVLGSDSTVHVTGRVFRHIPIQTTRTARSDCRWASRSTSRLRP